MPSNLLSDFFVWRHESRKVSYTWNLLLGIGAYHLLLIRRHQAIKFNVLNLHLNFMKFFFCSPLYFLFFFPNLSRIIRNNNSFIFEADSIHFFVREIWHKILIRNCFWGSTVNFGIVLFISLLSINSCWHQTYLKPLLICVSNISVLQVYVSSFATGDCSLLFRLLSFINLILSTLNKLHILTTLYCSISIELMMNFWWNRWLLNVVHPALLWFLIFIDNLSILIQIIAIIQIASMQLFEIFVSLLLFLLLHE